MVTIYHNPRCRKSRETLQLLEERGIEPNIVEYLNEPPNAEDLKEIIHMLGIAPKELIRKTEADFKENFKGKELTDDEWVEAMITYPKLIERPIVIKNKKAAIGRPPENVLNILD